MVEYSSLHNHTHGSLLDGFGTIPEYLERAKEIGLTGMGVTDHGNVTGIYSFIQQARSMDIIPTPGCEMYVAPINPDGAKAKQPIFYGKDGKKAAHDVSGNGAYLHATLLAVNNTGLKNLFKLSTLSNFQEHFYMKPRIDFEMLEQHSDGIVMLTGCPSSEISTRFLLGQDDKAYEYAQRLLEVFGKDRLFVEIMEHDMKSSLERRLLPKQVELAKKLGLGLVATNDSHYVNPEDHIHHEEMLCSQSKSKMSDKTYDEGGRRFAFDGTEYYLKSGEEMARIFPEDRFPGALSNTLLIAEMSQDISIDYDPHLRPHPPIPAGESEVEYFQNIINEGYKKRYGKADDATKKEALKRVRDEFQVFHSSDFIGYMISVYEYLKWARDNYSTFAEDGTPLAYSTGAGRGSVGGSIIAYCLGISEIDPIRFDLVFERFISAGRGSQYLIQYDDGTEEILVASEEKQVADSGEKKFIYQLEKGMTVEDIPETVEEDEKPKQEEKKDVFDDEDFDEEELHEEEFFENIDEF